MRFATAIFQFEGLLRCSLGEIWNFKKYNEERHRKLREDAIPVSELRFVYPEWGSNPDALLGSLGFKNHAIVGD
jgi:hypothetical protein